MNQVESVTVTAGSNLKHPPQLDLGLSELKSCRFAGNCQEENADNVGYYHGRVSSRLTDGMLVYGCITESFSTGVNSHSIDRAVFCMTNWY